MGHAILDGPAVACRRSWEHGEVSFWKLYVFLA
jgi:hypothetical protein